MIMTVMPGAANARVRWVAFLLFLNVPQTGKY
jgi:hypothetical protein